MFAKILKIIKTVLPSSVADDDFIWPGDYIE